MTAWEKSDPKYGVAVKRGTPDVPTDGRYHVMVDGEIVYSTTVEASALIEYAERRADRMSAGRKTLRAEASYRDAQDFRNEVLSEKAARKAKQGGRGKGGVGG